MFVAQMSHPSLVMTRVGAKVKKCCTGLSIMIIIIWPLVCLMYSHISAKAGVGTTAVAYSMRNKLWHPTNHGCNHCAISVKS